MTRSLATAVTLRPKRSSLVFAQILAALVGSAGVYLIWLWFTGSSGWTTALMGAAVLVFAPLYALSQSTLIFIATPEALESRQFGLRRWSIPMNQVGVQEGSTPFHIAMADMRVGKIRSELNVKQFDPAALETFSNYIDAARQALGVELTVSEPEEPTWREMVTGFAWPALVVFLLGAAQLGFSAFTQRLAPMEIARRAVLAVGAMALLFGGLALVLYIAFRFADRNKQQDE